MNDGDVGIWFSLGKNVFVSIPFVIFQGSPLRGSADQVQGPGPGTRSDGGVRGPGISVFGSPIKSCQKAIISR